MISKKHIPLAVFEYHEVYYVIKVLIHLSEVINHKADDEKTRVITILYVNRLNQHLIN